MDLAFLRVERSAVPVLHWTGEGNLGQSECSSAAMAQIYAEDTRRLGPDGFKLLITESGLQFPI